MDSRATNSATALAAEKNFSALNYLSLPIVFARAQGAEVVENDNVEIHSWSFVWLSAVTI
jgi:hypothetical protein